jgi:hypothetical protein
MKLSETFIAFGYPVYQPVPIYHPPPPIPYHYPPVYPSYGYGS